MKARLKDAQISLRFSTEVLEGMKAVAASENISLSDYLTRLHQQREKHNDIEERLSLLELIISRTQAFSQLDKENREKLHTDTPNSPKIQSDVA